MRIPKILKRLPAPIRHAGNYIVGAKERRYNTRATELLISRVATSPFFDDAYYASQRGREFQSAEHAARDWAGAGARKGYSLHPLIDPAYIPRDVREGLRSRDFDRYEKWLNDPANARTVWGPIFDPTQQHASDQEFCAETFFSGLESDQLIAPPRGFPGTPGTWGAIRASAIATAVSARAQAAVSAPGKYAVWDAAREAEWIAEAERLPRRGDVLVSVIMPAWNREDQISPAIDSVLAQTHEAWELIIVDDGSTDSTEEVVRAYMAEDPRIKFVSLSHGGVARARNSGFGVAEGEYFAFLDTDNTWTSRHLELSVRWLESVDGTVATHNGLRITEADGSQCYRGAQVGIDALAKRSLIDMNSLVVRRAVALKRGGFDEALARWVDYALILDIAEQGHIAYLPFIGCEYSDGDSADRITRSESEHWQFVAGARHVVRWDELSSRVSERVGGRVSVIVLVYEDYMNTIQAVDRVLATTETSDVEVILVDNGSRLYVGRIVAARYQNHPRVRYQRLTRNYNFATGCNFGYAISTGEFVMFLNNDTVVRDGWLDPLIDRLESTDAIGVQPLMLYPNGTVQTAGTVFVIEDGMPIHFLARHPREDAFRSPGDDFAAVTAGALLVRAELFERLRGFDPIFANGCEDIDFCLRARELTGRSFHVESRSLVEHKESKSPGRFAHVDENRRILLERWRGRMPSSDVEKFREVGFEVPHVRPLAGGQNWMPLVTRPKREVEVEGLGRVPSLRWAIKIGASGTYWGDWWGDTIFAEDLRTSLERLGQEVVIDRFGAFERETSYLDDVVLTLRGLRKPVPQAGRVNILWVMSHPELVSVEEVRRHDLVYAGSERWAREMSSDSGREVQKLLQATNPDRFKPRRRDDELASDLLFVGGARFGAGGRPLVEMAIDSGADVSLWGPGWSHVSPEQTRGEYLPFKDTPLSYASAKIVLNDHLDVMRDAGFINNRTFDAVAAGVPVITDEVEGLEIFGGAVRSCGSPEEMKEMTADRSWIPDRTRFEQISAMVARDHSFDARAAVMLRDVLNFME
ncbi:glycosyl transferase family 2 [Xylanimonas cellulosilytica DSM 15894]|uniref:Glycosyl transferase family 2 n=2 Tax=Xylanimonas TaxID=186188 RepID=D1BX28_XYLCX|nr:glycosyl transferase family 2 [Xylanimonas cellulosilytica DSM 15894]